MVKNWCSRVWLVLEPVPPSLISHDYSPQRSLMSPIYTVGDFTVAQVGPALFTVGSEPFGTLAYISTLAEAERRGHELAQTHGVSLWLADVTHPRTFLIATYRPPHSRV
jgi:hypothetical protein